MSQRPHGLDEVEYSKELDEELKLLLQEYRDGKISVKDLLKLVDTSCRDHLDFKIMDEFYVGKHRQSDPEDSKS